MGAATVTWRGQYVFEFYPELYFGSGTRFQAEATGDSMQVLVIEVVPHWPHSLLAAAPLFALGLLWLGKI
jgi:hypothetical protein